jgi:hypothetical protein
VRVISQEGACQRRCENEAVRNAFAPRRDSRRHDGRRDDSRRTADRPSLVVGLCAVAILVAPTVRTACAQDEHKEATAVTAKLVEPTTDSAPGAQPHLTSKLAGRYFVDFRARTAASYGHAFLWYGRLNERGKVGLIEVAGLHPASDSPVPYILGHLIPVPAETGKSYGDLDEQYLTANYRIYLKEADARRVFAYIKHKQETSPLWLAGVYNCTAFLADIAGYMGLRTPVTATWMYPEDFINNLRDLNGGRQEISLAANH